MPCQQGLMNGVVAGWLRIKLVTQLIAKITELLHQVLPFTHPYVIEKFFLAELAPLVIRQRLLLRIAVGPEVDKSEEVGLRVGKTPVHLVRFLLGLQRPLARVLNCQGGSDDQHFL